MPLFPPLNIHTVFDSGQTSDAERKDALQPESGCFPETTKKERTKMSNKNNNQINIPQAREAMDKFKMQAAQDLDVSSTY